MIFGNSLLAILLLSGTPPAELKDPAHLKKAFPALQPALIRTCLEWEILDVREVRYMLAKADDFPGDLEVLQRRHKELADAPFLEDAFRFPDRSLINELLVFNRAYRNYLEARLPFDPAHEHELRQALRVTDKLYQIWDTVRDIRCEYYYTSVRRQALKRLRELLGEDAYWTADLPPHVPFEFFTELDGLESHGGENEESVYDLDW